MTPHDIRVLLHYYVSPEPYPTSPILSDTLQSFIQRGIISPHVDAESGFRVTPKGGKLVQMLCDTPDPINVWMDPREKPCSTSS